MTTTPTTNLQAAAPRRQSLWRKLPAMASVPMLGLPSAMGVEKYLEPIVGWFAAWSAAAGFETMYIGVNILVINSPELRRYARNIMLLAVLTAVTLNTLAHYQTRMGGDILAVDVNWPALILSLVESLPLAGLSCAISVLLHLISYEEAGMPPPAPREPRRWNRPTWLRWPEWLKIPELPSLLPPAQPLQPAPAPAGSGLPGGQNPIPYYPCPHGCGAFLDTGAYGRAMQHGRCERCPKT